jgi:hypothetical protein
MLSNWNKSDLLSNKQIFTCIVPATPDLVWNSYYSTKLFPRQIIYLKVWYYSEECKVNSQSGATKLKSLAVQPP